MHRLTPRPRRGVDRDPQRREAALFEPYRLAACAPGRRGQRCLDGVPAVEADGHTCDPAVHSRAEYLYQVEMIRRHRMIEAHL